MSEKYKEIFHRPSDERAILSFCINNVNDFYSLMSKVSTEDFLCNEHKILFSILHSLEKKGIEKFDSSIVIEEARNAGVLDVIGGYEYLYTIIERQSNSSENFDFYLKNILEASTKYKLYSKLQNNLTEIVDNAKDGKDSSDLIGMVENNVLDLSTQSKAVKEPIDFAERLKSYIEERRDTRIDMLGLSTGYPILDKQIDGLVPGTLFVAAARKKKGKSALLTNIAAHAAFRERKPVLYVDTELPFSQWNSRVISLMSGVKERVITHGGYDDEDYDKLINRCVKLVEKGLLFHEYMPGYTVDKLVALYKKYKIKYDIGLAVFDYIKEPDLGSVDGARKEYQLLGDVTTKLKDLAGELDIPFLAAVQLNRQNKIADSDRIARYGDIIADWSERTEEEITHGGTECGSHKLVIKDSRRGGGTSIEGIGYWFFKDYISIKEVSPEKQLRRVYEDGEVVNESTETNVSSKEHEDDYIT